MTEQPEHAAREGQRREAVAHGLQMKARNPITVWLLWPILTVGIYSLVWLFLVTRELSEFDRRRSISPITPVLVVIFLGWLIIPALIVYYNMGSQIARSQRAAGLQVTCSPIAAMLLILLFGAGIAYLQAEANKVIDVYPDAVAGEQVPLYG